MKTFKKKYEPQKQQQDLSSFYNENQQTARPQFQTPSFIQNQVRSSSIYNENQQIQRHQFQAPSLTKKNDHEIASSKKTIQQTKIQQSPYRSPFSNYNPQSEISNYTQQKQLPLLQPNLKIIPFNQNKNLPIPPQSNYNVIENERKRQMNDGKISEIQEVIQKIEDQLPSIEELEKSRQLKEMKHKLSLKGIKIPEIIKLLNLPRSLLDQDQDAGWINKSKETKYRGRINSNPKEYYQPVGCYGIGLSVSKYGNENWLNSDDGKNTWIVLYHKTKPEMVLSILKYGLIPGPCQSFEGQQCILGRGTVGTGVYFSDMIENTFRYGSNLEVNNNEIVNPKSVKIPTRHIFAVSNVSDIRPYRILIVKSGTNQQIP